MNQHRFGDGQRTQPPQRQVPPPTGIPPKHDPPKMEESLSRSPSGTMTGPPPFHPPPTRQTSNTVTNMPNGHVNDGSNAPVSPASPLNKVLPPSQNERKIIAALLTKQQREKEQAQEREKEENERKRKEDEERHKEEEEKRKEEEERRKQNSDRKN